MNVEREIESMKSGRRNSKWENEKNESRGTGEKGTGSESGTRK